MMKHSKRGVYAGDADAERTFGLGQCDFKERTFGLGPYTPTFPPKYVQDNGDM